MRYKVDRIDDKVVALEKQLEETKREFNVLENNIAGQLKDVSDALNKLALGFSEFKAEITKFIYEKVKL